MTEFASTLPIPHERVLLQELNHGISNEFFSAMSLVSLAAARSGSDEVKVALSGVTELLRHYAEVHQALQSPRDDARIDAATYLSKLCLSIRRSKLDQAENRPRTCGASFGAAFRRMLATRDDCLRAYNKCSTARICGQERTDPSGTVVRRGVCSMQGAGQRSGSGKRSAWKRAQNSRGADQGSRWPIRAEVWNRGIHVDFNLPVQRANRTTARTITQKKRAAGLLQTSRRSG